MGKNIVCLIESLGAGGAERQMVLLSSLLKKKGHDVRVWTYYMDDFYSMDLRQAGVKHECIRNKGSKWKRLLSFRKKMKENPPDVVIAYLDGAAMTACALKATGLHFRLIVSERNTTQQLTIRESLKFFLYRFADAIVPNSYTQAFFLEKQYENLKSKISVIHNYVDISHFVPSTAEKHYSEVVNVLVVARIMPQKNVLSFMRVLYQLRNMKYHLKVRWVGSSVDRNYQKQVDSLYEELSMTDCLTFVSPKNGVLEEYHSADVFCLPSLYEGFPNVLGEAISCGLPALCSNVCDNSYMVEERENGFLFDPLSQSSMVNTFVKFFSLSEMERSEMGTKSRLKAKSIFSEVQFVSKYENLFE